MFVKNEEAGKVKTRLAETIGDEKALEVYRQLLAFTQSQSREVMAEKEVWYSSYIPQKDRWNEGGFLKKKQTGDDLGKRMSDAFNGSFHQEERGKVVLIGSDCPGLNTEIIEEAFLQLNKHDVVIGPASDGGYYLIGMRKFIPEIFKGIAWSTNSVFKDSVKIINKKGLSVFVLDKLNDIDTVEDLVNFELRTLNSER